MVHVQLLFAADILSVFFFAGSPGVTQSVTMACSSCVMASLSSSLLCGIFIWSGFFTVSSVSIHWNRIKPTYINKIVVFLSRHSDHRVHQWMHLLSLWACTRESWHLRGSLSPLPQRDPDGRKRLARKSGSVWTKGINLHDLPFLSKWRYKSLRKAGQCWQWRWSAWWE